MAADGIFWDLVEHPFQLHMNTPYVIETGLSICKCRCLFLQASLRTLLGASLRTLRASRTLPRASLKTPQSLVEDSPQSIIRLSFLRKRWMIEVLQHLWYIIIYIGVFYFLSFDASCDHAIFLTDVSQLRIYMKLSTGLLTKCYNCEVHPKRTGL